MRIKYVVTFVLVMAVSLLLIGCGEVPQAQIDEAKRVYQIDISSQADGVYFLTILSGRQVLYRQKLVKL